MSLFDEIEDALKQQPNDILHFDRFTIIKKVRKRSQQGMVVIAKTKINKKFAIKFYRPSDKDPNLLKDSMERFKREISILASLNHKNIVKIHAGGKAIWHDKEKRWEVVDGVDSKDLKTNEILYYIMDFIEGSDVTSIFSNLEKESDDRLKSDRTSNFHELKLFEDMIFQISDAMNYYHSQKITHKDIKPDNIRFSTNDSTFIIVDFGFARHITSPQDGSTIPRTEYLDMESIEAKNYELNDMGQFCRVLLKILPFFEDEYDPTRYEGIKNAIEKGKNSHLDERYRTMKEFFEAVRPFFITSLEWRFQPKLNEYLCPNRFGRFSFKLRIPVSGSVPLSEEVKEIVDTPEFQRLKGVRQLGPAFFVFPGANSTRFEHSLGTYILSMKYLEKIIDLPTFRSLCGSISETIKLIVLSSLLHDIGHYPYSHWVEEIHEFPRGIKFPSHEERAREIICEGRIGELIENKWEVDPEELSNIIAEKHIGGRNILINSFIKSPIDVDKIDYLVRDSIHCGVEYGKGIDIERLLDSLYIDQDTKKICLTDKGRSSLLSILTCRNIMYQEIYWHKTVRACNAMFKRFFYEYIRRELEDIDKIERHFELSDDCFINELLNKTRRYADLNKLISPFAFKGRSLYKPAYIFLTSDASEEPTDTRRFFHKIMELTYEDMVNLSEKLIERLKNKIPGIKPLDIIIEKTPIKKDHEVYDLKGFKIWNIRKERFEKFPTEEIIPLNQFLERNARAYLFCNPKYYDDLKKMSPIRLDELFGEI
jgi:HD superfamily phosphohydrolase